MTVWVVVVDVDDDTVGSWPKMVDDDDNDFCFFSIPHPISKFD